MKEYEVIWEIFNKCPRNQMRDVFVEEVEIEDPEEYIKEKRTCQLKRGAYVFGCDFNLQDKEYLKKQSISIFDEPEEETVKPSLFKTLCYKLHTFL